MIIDERLKAEGWPRGSSAKRMAENKVRECEDRVDLAEALLAGRPDNEAAIAHHAHATNSLIEAEQDLRRLAGEPSQQGSFHEAVAKLREASLHGAMRARADLYRPGCPVQSDVEVPSAAFDPMADVDYSADTVVAPWGDIYRNVRYRVADLDRLYDDAALVAGAEEPEAAEPAPPLSAAPDAVLLPVTEEPASPARDNALADLEPKLVTAAYQWLLKHVEQETKLAEQEDRQFHKLALTDSDLRQRCRAKTGATWRDYHAAFRKLPLEVRQKPRRSSTKR